jgi:transcriptional regulator with XRE-family HTH domain
MAVQFPQVSGSNLERKRLNLPQDFEGQVNLLFVAFQQWQQGEVNTWIPTAQDLEAAHPDLRYYELPTIRPLNRLAQAFINGGMRAGIPDRLARQRTITLYLDKEAFRSALDLPDEAHIYLLLIDDRGQELWRERGVFSPEKGDALKARVAEAMNEAGT